MGKKYIWNYDWLILIGTDVVHDILWWYFFNLNFKKKDRHMVSAQFVIIESFVKFYQFLIYCINFRLDMDIVWVCIYIFLFTAHVVHMFFFFIHSFSYSGKTYSKSFYPFRKKMQSRWIVETNQPRLTE